MNLSVEIESLESLHRDPRLLSTHPSL